MDWMCLLGMSPVLCHTCTQIWWIRCVYWGCLPSSAIPVHRSDGLDVCIGDISCAMPYLYVDLMGWMSVLGMFSHPLPNLFAFQRTGFTVCKFLCASCFLCSKKSLPVPRYILVYYAFGFKVRSVIQCELSSVYGMRWSQVHLFHKAVRFSSTICWKHSFPHWFTLAPYEKLYKKGWGYASVGQMPATQACRSEFRSPKPI